MTVTPVLRRPPAGRCHRRGGVWGTVGGSRACGAGIAFECDSGRSPGAFDECASGAAAGGEAVVLGPAADAPIECDLAVLCRGGVGGDGWGCGFRRSAGAGVLYDDRVGGLLAALLRGGIAGAGDGESAVISGDRVQRAGEPFGGGSRDPGPGSHGSGRCRCLPGSHWPRRRCGCDWGWWIAAWWWRPRRPTGSLGGFCHCWSRTAVGAEGAAAMVLCRASDAPGGVRLRAVSEPVLYGKSRTPAVALGRVRQALEGEVGLESGQGLLLVDGAGAGGRLARAERAAWGDWVGERWSPRWCWVRRGRRAGLGNAWRPSRGCRRGRFDRAVVSLVGSQENAIGAVFEKIDRVGVGASS